jgi:neopullulanase
VNLHRQILKKVYLYSLILSLTSLVMACEGESKVYRLPAVRSCDLSIRYQAKIDTKKVSVVGQFQSQNWQEIPLRLIDPSTQQWALDLVLKPGEYFYYLMIDGQKVLDPHHALTAQVSGQEYTWVEIVNCQQGRWYRVQRTPLPNGHWNFILAYERAVDQPIQNTKGVPLQPESVRVLINQKEQSVKIENEILQLSTIGLELELEPGKHLLKIEGKDQVGNDFQVFQAPFWIEETPFHWSDGSMYQIVLDRFNPPQVEPKSTPSIADRWGGNLQKVLEALQQGYFDQFAIQSIWISPLYSNPSGRWQGVEGGIARYQGYHGYWPIHPRQVGKEWGQAETLHKIIALAHQKGIRVILDIVLNHVHQEHPYVKQYPQWFTPRGCLCGRAECSWYLWIETCQFTTYLPDVRWEGTAVIKQQVDDALWWMEEFDLDGLRVDAVPMMPRRVIYYLSEQVKKRFEGLRVRHLLIGETFTGPSDHDRIAWYLGNKGLDGQFDFPLMWSIRSTLAWQSTDMTHLQDIWKQSVSTWQGSESIMGHFVSNHDVTRFLSEARADDLSDPWNNPPVQKSHPSAYRQMALAYAFILSLSGIAVLYYADEIGMAGANDPDNRRPYWPWGIHRFTTLLEQQKELFKSVQWLTQFRQCYLNPLSKNARVEWLKVDREHLSFIRYDQDSAVIISLQRKTTRLEDGLVLPSSLYRYKQWYDVKNQTWYNIDEDSMLLSVPSMSPYQFRFLVNQVRDCL